MIDVDEEAWRRFGKRIHNARVLAGHGDTKGWADLVGRSTKTLLGLERGTPVSIDTLEQIDRAMDWPPRQALLMLGEEAEITEEISRERRSPVPVGGGVDPELLAQLADSQPDEIEKVKAYLRGIRDGRA